MGWEVYPQGLYDLLVAFRVQPGKLYITENGASYSDGPDEDGRVHDERAWLLTRPLRGASERSTKACPWPAISSGR